MHTLALAMCLSLCLYIALVALRCWLLQQYSMFVWLSGAAITIFRFELAILFGLILVMELARGHLKVWTFLVNVIPAGVVWLGESRLTQESANLLEFIVTQY